MADTYRHIFGVKIGDIHMPDIILQRRIFLTLLPSLEKSKKEATALGRITLAQIRLATAVGLGGGEVMGAWDMIVDSSVTASRVPFAIITDEYAAIAVDGFAEIFTQGRSLGICGILASQDWAGIKKANEAEAQQIVANTKFKMIMTTDDPNDTRKLIMDLSGEIEEMRSGGYQLKGVINYTDGLSAQAHKTARVDMLDIAAMVEGEFHMFFKDRLIRGKSFFAGGEPETANKSTTAMFVHHLLMIERPSEQLISSKFGSLRAIVDKWKSGEHRRLFDMEAAEGFAPVARTMASGQPGGPVYGRIGRRDLAAAAFIAWCDEYVFDADAWIMKKQSKNEIFTIGDAEDAPDYVVEKSLVSQKPGGIVLTTDDEDGFDPDDEDDSGQVSSPVAIHRATDDERDEKANSPLKSDGDLSGLEANDGLLVNAPRSSYRVESDAELPMDKPDAHEKPAQAESAGGNYYEQVGPNTKNLFGEVMEAILGDKPETNFVNAGVHMGETREDSRAAAKHLTDMLSDAMRTPAYPDKPEPEKTDPRDYKLRLDSWIKKLDT